MAEENAQSIKRLIIKRGHIKAQLTKFQTFLESIVLPEKMHELRVRKQNIEKILEDFRDIQLELEMLDPETDHSVETDAFEKNYFENMGSANFKLEQNTGRDSDTSSNTNIRNSLISDTSNDNNLGIKLPEIKLPEFNGNYDRWISFQESFKSLIHNNAKLNKIQKFFYLKSVLKDEALKVINNLDVTEANYDVAWGLLDDRYQNKKLIAHSHLKSIFELPIIIKENYNSLRLFLDTFLLNFRALKSLNNHTEHWDAILIYLLNSKLDIKTKREWENHTKDNLEPTIDEFEKFLSNKCQLLQTIENKTTSNSKDLKKEYKTTSYVNTHKHVDNSNNKNYKCIFCNGTHLIYFCDKFLNIPVNSRYEHVKKLHVCLNCLKPGHIAANCRFNACKKCRKKHNGLLHFESPSQEISQANKNTVCQLENKPHMVTAESEQEQLPNLVSTTLTVYTPKECFVLLATAVVFVTNYNGELNRCRALLDNASQSNFMSKKLVKELKLKCENINLPVTSLNNISNAISQRTTCTFNSLYNNFSCTSKFLIVEKIAENLPQVIISTNSLKIPSGINLADPEFNVPGDVDLLIGAQLFWDLLQVGQIKLNSKGPVLQKTCLGWLVSGPVPQKMNSTVCNLNISNELLSKQLESFWLVEEKPLNDIKTSFDDENKCEKHFLENYVRDNTGRFVVKLPFSKSPDLLGESKQQAINRFLNLERKFDKDKELYAEYKKFMDEYQHLGHMKPVDINAELQLCYYLPHHCVVKNDSLTTKHRVVFDASAKSSTNVSLNDILMVGPYIQDELFSILIRFRLHNIVLVADISKMYRQVMVDKNDHKFQKIIWRDNKDQDMKIYELQTITYGTAPASFLATRCLKQVALDNSNDCPLASEIIQRDFYMDDLLTGAFDIPSAILLKLQLETILSSAGFVLRKWISNESMVLKNDLCDQAHYLITDEDQIKALGVIWDSIGDQFKFVFKESNNMNAFHISKRMILSTIARIFDPIGLLSPVIMKAKCFMQKLWQINIDWDQSIPLTLQTEWLYFYKQLPHLVNISVPRQITLKNSIEFQLHGFSDASELGYGSCIYLLAINNLGNISSNLICSKSRVAPIKTISIPRLELNGAVMLAKLMRYVIKSLKLDISQIKYWCDSTIVLQWLSKPPGTWKIFVCNRVSTIQQISNIDSWNYVPSGENPADIISRGCFPLQLENNILWWNGPCWLKQGVEFWPVQSWSKISEDIPDSKTKKVTNFNTVTNEDIFYRFSTFNKLIRVVSWIFRFNKNSRLAHENRTFSQLTVSECQDSIIRLSRLAQLEFSPELFSLTNNKKLSSKSKLLSLSPFVDENKVIRVGGRLRHSNLSFEQKHPIILPKIHQFSKLIIRYEHHKNLHASAQSVLSQVRQQFWIINGKQAVRAEVRRCITCFRAKPYDNKYYMGDLPKSRVSPNRIFSSVGIDFAGPYLVKDGRLKNRKLVKTYFCIFVCMASKAIHLEVVGDLSTEGFLNALKRFVSRRGLCSDIFSDNATNFVGADNRIKHLSQITEIENFRNYLIENKIIWHYIPPRSPHFGGIWEAAVRSTKHFLKRVASNVHFTYEEFHTLLCQIESILNSRPLLALSNDPDDLDVLTPGHFIIGTSLLALPQSNVLEKPVSLLRRYELLQHLVQQFWCKWSKNYLNSIQQRPKWQQKEPSIIKSGSLVILKDDNNVPQQWTMGRVLHLHPGSDSVVRVVTVKTAKGEVKRAINRVCVLPVES